MSCNGCGDTTCGCATRGRRGATGPTGPSGPTGGAGPTGATSAVMKFSNLLPIPQGASEEYFMTDSITSNADEEPVHYPAARNIVLQNLYVTSRRSVDATTTLVFQVVVDDVAVPGFLVTFNDTPSGTTLGVTLSTPVSQGSVIDLQANVTSGDEPKVHIVSATIGFE